MKNTFYLLAGVMLLSLCGCYPELDYHLTSVTPHIIDVKDAPPQTKLLTKYSSASKLLRIDFTTQEDLTSLLDLYWEHGAVKPDSPELSMEPTVYFEENAESIAGLDFPLPPLPTEPQFDNRISAWGFPVLWNGHPVNRMLMDNPAYRAAWQYSDCHCATYSLYLPIEYRAKGSERRFIDQPGDLHISLEIVDTKNSEKKFSRVFWLHSPENRFDVPEVAIRDALQKAELK